MFPIRGLLSKQVTCPDSSTCNLSPCIFSHQVQPTTVATTASSSRLIPAKRSAAATGDDSPRKTTQTMDSYPEAHKLKALQQRQQQQQKTNLNAALPSSRTPNRPVSLAPLPQVSFTLYFPQDATISSFVSFPQVGPPRIINPRGPAHTPSVTRQKLLTALYEQ